MNVAQHIEELWLDGCEAVRGSALEVLRGAPKLRRISLHTRAGALIIHPSNFMEGCRVVDIVKSFPALQIAHIPQQRLAVTGSRNEDQRKPYAEWDQPWRGLAKYMHQKRKEDDTPCGFCSVGPTADQPGLSAARCWECGKRSCKDQSKGCPKIGSACVGCYRRTCFECKEKMAETAARKAAAAEAIRKPNEAIKFYKKVHLFRIAEENPDLEVKEILKLLKQEYAALDDGEQALYLEKAAADHERYEREKAAANAMEPGAEKAMEKCDLCQRKFCFVCVAKDFAPCHAGYAPLGVEPCQRVVCSDCSVLCESCGELHCLACAENFVGDLCPECDDFRSDEYSESDEW